MYVTTGELAVYLGITERQVYYLRDKLKHENGVKTLYDLEACLKFYFGENPGAEKFRIIQEAAEK